MIHEGKEKLYRHCAWEVRTEDTYCTTGFWFGSDTKIMDYIEHIWPTAEGALQKKYEGRNPLWRIGRLSQLMRDHQNARLHGPHEPIRCEHVAIPKRQEIGQ